MANINIATGTYFKFLASLRDVCKQSNVEIKDKEALAGALEFPELEHVAYICPVMSLEHVIDRIDGFVVEKLVVYEAANQAKEAVKKEAHAELGLIAACYLKEWQEEFDNTIEARERLQKLEDKKLNALVQKIKWPVFKDPEASYAEISKGLGHLLSKEVVYLKSRQGKVSSVTPAHVAALFDKDKSQLSATEKYLIDKYAAMQRTMEVTIENRPQIDLSSSCPEADVIMRESSSGLGEFDTLHTHTSWAEIVRQIEIKGIPTAAGKAVEDLLSKFYSIPNSNLAKLWEGVAALSAIRQYFCVHSHCALTPPLKTRFDREMTKVFILTWQSVGVRAWEGLDAIGPKICQSIMAIWATTENKAIKKEIESAFTAQILFPAQTAYIDAKDIYRIRHLLRCLRAQPWGEFWAVGAKLAEHIESHTSALFDSKEQLHRQGSLRNRQLVCLELLQEIYVEISYQAEFRNAGPFLALMDPARACKKHIGMAIMKVEALDAGIKPGPIYPPMLPAHHYLPPVYPGPLYKETTDQSLACAFALQISTKLGQEALLWKCLKILSAMSAPAATIRCRKLF